MCWFVEEENKRYKITKRQTDTKWPEMLAVVRGETDTDGGAKRVTKDWRLSEREREIKTQDSTHTYTHSRWESSHEHTQ